MKAAVVNAPGMSAVYAEFDLPVAKDGEELIRVRAAALSNVTKSRASGAHYSASGLYPAVAGTDGVGFNQQGRRVYFAMPDPPFGSLAEVCPIRASRCVAIPDALDDVTAAALANPGMSAWGGLVERGKLKQGEAVLVNGATGTAGRIAVQLAKHLGARQVIATGRNVAELEELKQIGADVVIPFALGPENPMGVAEYEEKLKEAFASGIDVVLDYLWGESAKTILSALAKTIEDKPVRFVQVGSAGGELSLELPAAILRSAAIELMGSGIGSVSRGGLVHAIQSVFEWAVPAGLTIVTRVVPLAEVATAWGVKSAKPRIVFTID